MKSRKFNVVTDGAFGSCGKGAIATYLALKHRPEVISTTNMPNAGHCQTADTYVITDSGLEKLGRAVMRGTSKKIVNMDGIQECISMHYYDGVRSVNKIDLSNGVSLRCTSAHKYYVWCISSNGFTWVKSTDLRADDHIFLFPKNVEFINDSLLPSHIDQVVKPNKTYIKIPPDTNKTADVRFAEYLGLLVGDGYYAGPQKITIAFHESQLDVADTIIQLYYDMGITGTDLSKIPDKRCYALSIRQTSGMFELFQEVGLNRAIKQHKTTPSGVLSSNKTILSAYLRGLFDADGSVKKDRVQLSNCAKSVVEDAQQMLYILGIHSTFGVYKCKRKTKAGHRLPQYTLSISGNSDVVRFMDSVGFMSKVKSDRLTKLANNRHDQGHIIPVNDGVKRKLRKVGLAGRKYTRSTALLAKTANATDLDLNNLRELCDKYHPVTIKSIKLKFSKEEVFDVTVPGTHSYLANGCISHNTAVFHDERKFIAKAIPSASILRQWVPDYDFQIMLGSTAAFTLDQLKTEVDFCGVADRLQIHPRAGVVTPAYKEAECSGANSTKHVASTMQGGGAFLADKIMRKADLKLARDYPELDQYTIPREMPSAVPPMPFHMMVNMSMRSGNTFLHEGSQGFSLDINHGANYPHCTSRGTTAVQNMADMGVNPALLGDVYLVIRPYPIRVGNVVEDGKQVGYSGDCYHDQREITWNDVAKEANMPQEVATSLFDKELTTVTKRLRRVYTFSNQQLIEAVIVNGATKIAANFMNYVDWNCRNTNKREDVTQKVWDFVHKVEDLAGIPVTLIGTGPRTDQIIDLED